MYWVYLYSSPFHSTPTQAQRARPYASRPLKPQRIRGVVGSSGRSRSALRRRSHHAGAAAGASVALPRWAPGCGRKRGRYVTSRDITGTPTLVEDTESRGRGCRTRHSNVEVTWRAVALLGLFALPQPALYAEDNGSPESTDCQLIVIVSR
jgi:hypothetical protein